MGNAPGTGSMQWPRREAFASWICTCGGVGSGPRLSDNIKVNTIIPKINRLYAGNEIRQ